MRRREFISLLGGATAWPAAVLGQANIKTIGVLMRSAPGSERFWQLFPEMLRELGYIEGQNIRFELRSDEVQMSRLPDLAAQLVARKVDVVVSWFTPAAIAAKEATDKIPIVCALCGDMVATGLAESLARPGGNVTGATGLGPELNAKLVELIRDMLPSAHRIAVLVNSPDPYSTPFLKQIEAAGAITGTVIEPIMMHSAEQLDAAFPAMERARPDALIVQPSLPTKRAAELALQSRIPAVCAVRAFVHDGGLLSYCALEADLYRRAAVLVDKILKGAKPADVPVEQPTKFELIINLKTAKALKMNVPPTLLARADEVID